MMEKAATKASATNKKAQKAKRLFFVGLLDLSWRLAAVIIIPMFIGSIADKKLDKAPIFTIIGLVIGFGLSAWVIYTVVVKLQKKTLKDMESKDNA